MICILCKYLNKKYSSKTLIAITKCIRSAHEFCFFDLEDVLAQIALELKLYVYGLRRNIYIIQTKTEKNVDLKYRDCLFAVPHPLPLLSTDPSPETQIVDVGKDTQSCMRYKVKPPSVVELTVKQQQQQNGCHQNCMKFKIRKNLYFGGKPDLISN